MLVLCTASRTSSAQQQTVAADEAKEKIKAIQIKYLAQKLDLTAEEAQKFWPVYDNYTREVELLIAERHQRKQQEKISGPDADNIARTNMDKELDYEKKMLDIRSRYTSEFQRVLPGRKAGMVFKSEREFRSIMLNHLRNQRLNRIRPGMSPGTDTRKQY
ncbi:hypothetical protein [Chitinophaga nivalis]|uniref:Sensor of ECF-type sigma factor n=1 Tax=Chitinophaga nivalis TaxID=2991709 RepID=A0ABT3IU23_9BACT|nr:hypothetical protein [Chitinophaga nivalis]MCW3462909.1 hypothetical protein [Chitinophaga nivalis]MCW3487401.1 hypothetical protein [Chitinophaga nivalis]